MQNPMDYHSHSLSQKLPTSHYNERLTISQYRQMFTNNDDMEILVDISDQYSTLTEQLFFPIRCYADIFKGADLV